MTRVECIRSMLFVDGSYCKFDKDDMCCSTLGCPYRVKVLTETTAAGKRAMDVVTVLFERHWHDDTKESIAARRRRIATEARTIAEKGDGWEALAAVHAEMKEMVRCGQGTASSGRRRWGRSAVLGKPASTTSCSLLRTRRVTPWVGATRR